MKPKLSEVFVENILKHDNAFSLALADYDTFAKNLIKAIAVGVYTVPKEAHINVLQSRIGGIKYVYMQQGNKDRMEYERIRGGRLVAVVIDKELLSNATEDNVYISDAVFSDYLMTPKTKLLETVKIKNKCIDKYLKKYVDNLDISSVELKHVDMNNVKIAVNTAVLSGNDESGQFNYMKKASNIIMDKSAALNIILHPEKEEEIFVNLIENSCAKKYFLINKAQEKEYFKQYAQEKNNMPKWKSEMVSALTDLGGNCVTVKIEYIADGEEKTGSAYRNSLLDNLYRNRVVAYGDFAKREDWCFPKKPVEMSDIKTISYRNKIIWRKY